MKNRVHTFMDRCLKLGVLSWYLFISVIFGAIAPPAAYAQVTIDDLNSINAGTEDYDPNGECSVGDKPVSTASSGSTYILGDSITNGAKATYEQTFSQRSLQVFVNALDSRTVVGGPAPSGMDALDIDKDKVAAAGTVVIALGTNTGGFSAENVGAMIDKIRDPNGINSKAKIYWVDTVNYSNLNSTKSSNAVIYGQSGAKDFTVISWFKAVNPAGDPQNPTDTSDANGYLSDDKVHLSAAGYPALVNLVADTVGGTSPNQPAPTDGSTSTTPAPTPNAAAPTTANNTAYNGEEIWTPDLLQKVQEFRPFYEKAAEAAGIPWAMLAIAHKHETRFARENPSNGQGIFQDVQRLNGPYPAGPVSDEEFQRQADWAARLILEKAKSNPEGRQDLANADAIKETFWGYNGKAYRSQAASLGFDPDTQGFEGSPYVMNKADARRDPAVAAPGTWGQIKRDFGPIEYPANNFFGSWVMYAAIAGIGGGTTAGAGTCQAPGTGVSTAGSPSAQKIIDIARRELEAGAKEADKSYHKYSMGRNEPWCADFVSWVFREAGTPFTGGYDEWNVPAVDGVLAWFKANGEYNAKGDYIPRPGDVVIMKNGHPTYPSHVNLVVAVNGDEITTIGGNESDTIKERKHSRTAAYITGYGTKVK